MSASGADSLLVISSRLTGIVAGKIAQHGRERRLPVIASWREFAESAAAQHSVDDCPDQWRLLVRADFVSGLARDRPMGRKQRSCSQNWDRVIFSDAAISIKSGLFETLQHMVVRCLRAELRGEPLSV